MAKKKLDNLMKESKIRDREDPDSFTITALPPAGKPTEKTGSKVNTGSNQKHQFPSQTRTAKFIISLKFDIQ